MIVDVSPHLLCIKNCLLLFHSLEIYFTAKGNNKIEKKTSRGKIYYVVVEFFFCRFNIIFDLKTHCMFAHCVSQNSFIYRVDIIYFIRFVVYTTTLIILLCSNNKVEKIIIIYLFVFLGENHFQIIFSRTQTNKTNKL